MGLTLHYELHAPNLGSMAEARSALADLRRFAASLPLKRCSKLLEWNADKGDPEFAKWHCYFVAYDPADERKFLEAVPVEVVRFAINHPGSETASFGLARHAPLASDPCHDVHDRPTGLVGWNWHGFCKTQYASLSRYGGWDNFFQVHDGLCKILDEAARLGLQVVVRDDGGYWENRDAAKLRAQIEHWNEMVAAVTGKFKDALAGQDGAVVAPITEDPTFEHLEARGQKTFKRHLDALNIEDLDLPRE